MTSQSGRCGVGGKSQSAGPGRTFALLQPVAGAAKMRIGVCAVQATSAAEVSGKAIDRLRDLVPVTDTDFL